MCVCVRFHCGFQFVVMCERMYIYLSTCVYVILCVCVCVCVCVLGGRYVRGCRYVCTCVEMWVCDLLSPFQSPLDVQNLLHTTHTHTHTHTGIITLPYGMIHPSNFSTYTNKTVLKMKTRTPTIILTSFHCMITPNSHDYVHRCTYYFHSFPVKVK